jgi:hypothetical protein
MKISTLALTALLAGNLSAAAQQTANTSKQKAPKQQQIKPQQAKQTTVLTEKDKLKPVYDEKKRRCAAKCGRG